MRQLGALEFAVKVPSEFIVLAREKAASHGMDPALVCALIDQESAWNTCAIRYEPGFRIRYVSPLRLPPSEEIARSISWGLMQVMGQVAREHEFTGKFLSALCDPATGVEVGCRVLSAKITEAAGDFTRGLQLWNGGANCDYAAQVLARMGAYR